MLIFFCACTPPQDSAKPDVEDTDSGTTDSGVTEDSADTGETADTADTDTTETADTGDTGDTTLPPADPTYSVDVFPVYADYCGDCHADWGGPGDAAATYDFLLNGEFRPLVVPGDRDGSWLYDKIGHNPPDDGKSPMPIQVSLVEGDDLTLLRDWITDGAKDDATYTQVYKQIWQARHCYNCHDEWGFVDQPFTYNALMTVEVGGYPLIDPGNPDNSLVYLKVASASPPFGDQMPIRYDFLDPTVVERIGQWIDLGALDN